MREFFRGWKRKAGCVTLVMAFVFAAGWIRSQFVADTIKMVTGAHVADAAISTRGLICWATRRTPSRDYDVPASGPLWETSKSYDLRGLMDTGTPTWTWRFKMFGLGQIVEGDASSSFLFFPYWSITFPTALSAYLLLSNPKQPQPSKEQPT